MLSDNQILMIVKTMKKMKDFECNFNNFIRTFTGNDFADQFISDTVNDFMLSILDEDLDEVAGIKNNGQVNLDLMKSLIESSDPVSFYREYIEQAATKKPVKENRSDIILANVLGELLDKTFDYNQEDWYKYITMELGVTNEDLINLEENGCVIYDIENVPISFKEKN